MSFLSDIGRETADKAARLVAFLNTRFSSEEQNSGPSAAFSEAAVPEDQRIRTAANAA
jgi:hypothetical protein